MYHEICVESVQQLEGTYLFRVVYIQFAGAQNLPKKLPCRRGSIDKYFLLSPAGAAVIVSILAITSCSWYSVHYIPSTPVVSHTQ